MALFTAVEALKIALQIEKNGEVFYNAAATKATDPGVKALFKELAVQEQQHWTTFQKMAQLAKWMILDSPRVDIESDEYQVYLQAALDNALFAGPDNALAMAEQSSDRQTALRVAVGFEKDTLLFFYDLSEMVSAPERETIAGIIREEKTHLRRLAKLL